MERNEQENFREVISKRQLEIETELADAAKEVGVVEPDSAIGRLSRLDTMQIREMALATRQRLREEKARLVDAEHRIESGTFGRCALCGKDIAHERLQIQPDAVVCVPCAQKRK
jgi:DnaK suppressor protein